MFQEIRVALATGMIQAGSTVKLANVQKKNIVNDIEAMEQKLSVLRNNLNWTERLDLTINMEVSFSSEIFPWLVI